MTDPMSRLWERHEHRVETGARRYIEQEQKAINMLGEGGVKLSDAEKDELYWQVAVDPTAQQMAEIVARRQAANKLGPAAIPRDWFEWDVKMNARMAPATDQEEAL